METKTEMSVEDQRKCHESLNAAIAIADKAAKKAFGTKKTETLKLLRSKIIEARAVLIAEVMAIDFKD